MSTGILVGWIGKPGPIVPVRALGLYEWWNPKTKRFQRVAMNRPAKFSSIDVATVPREDLPELLGVLVEAEARVRLRLAEPVEPARVDRIITAEQAAVIAGTSKRWLNKETAGKSFRCDLSRARVRYEESGLRAWLTMRRSR